MVKAYLERGINQGERRVNNVADVASGKPDFEYTNISDKTNSFADLLSYHRYFVVFMSTSGLLNLSLLTSGHPSSPTDVWELRSAWEVVLNLRS